MDCPLSGGRSGTGPARKVITPRNGNLTNVIPSRLRDCRTNAALSNPEGLSFKVAISLLSHKLRYGRGIPTEDQVSLSDTVARGNRRFSVSPRLVSRSENNAQQGFGLSRCLLSRISL